jgi:hypothetical protein
MERENSIVEGGYLHTVRQDPTSGRDLTNRTQNTTEKFTLYITIEYLLKHCYMYSTLFIKIIQKVFVCTHVSELRGLLIGCVQDWSMIAKV